MINWITTNYPSLAAAIGSFVIGARVLIKLLPDPKVDTAFEHFVDLLKHVGLVVAPTSDVATTIANTPAQVTIPAPAVNGTPAAVPTAK